ncbi:hypothetical protein CEUSTIGMA_g4818.t1 [Chlamydomonas eustigma]|uniref:MAU2 chromatid cohesion factor homolog n=1 Tax=Chlamydomonas eustigma TaxID=1157962 RepID=A0A250X393_9CHLO|nr:hypothetical protein CEUSTIGMA_g4818.t1 [Chlamydomonas eustigma]|eukprot:GAX77372.1 hypothetical protein CEUSTIGMA_g4818.t1 [Chlamydomonas eustigma]
MAADALSLLAIKFEQDGFPLHAIHCLQGLITLRLLPEQEARVRCKLGHLLVNHTRNLKMAKTHLKQASLLSQRLMGAYALKAQVSSYMGELCKYTAEIDVGIQALRNGLDACKQGASSSEREELHAWACHLYLQLAELLMNSGTQEAVHECIDEGLIAATEARQPSLQVLFLLAGLQLAIASPDTTHVSQLLSSLSTLLMEPSLGNTMPPAFIPYIQLHFNMLQALNCMSLGKISEMDTPSQSGARGSLLLVETIEDLLSQVESMYNNVNDIGYKWLPPQALRVIMSLTAAEILTNSGNIDSAHQHLETAAKSVQALLSSMCLLPALPDQSMSSLSEESLDHIQLWEARHVLAMSFAVSSQRAQLRMLQGQFIEARLDLQAALSKVMMFPNLLSDKVPHAHVLVGLYCHATARYSHAEAHFAAAAESLRQSGASEPASLAAASLQACSALSQEGPESVSRAIDAIGGLQQDATGHLTRQQEGMGLQESCVLQMVSGVIRLRLAASSSSSEACKEHEQSGRMLLTRALRVAHRQLRHHQLVTSLMLVTAPLQLRGGCSASGSHTSLLAAASNQSSTRAAAAAAAGPSSAKEVPGVVCGVAGTTPAGMNQAMMLSPPPSNGGGAALSAATLSAASSIGGSGLHMDIAGAEQMLASAVQLAKNNGDLATTAALKRAMLDVFTARGDHAKHAAALADVQTREKNLQVLRRAAVYDAEADDAALLAWKLF